MSEPKEFFRWFQKNETSMSTPKELAHRAAWTHPGTGHTYRSGYRACIRHAAHKLESLRTPGTDLHWHEIPLDKAVHLIQSLLEEQE